MSNPHPDKTIRTLAGTDVNGRVMVECTTCKNIARAVDETQAKADLATTSCNPGCANCQRLRQSASTAPAVPTGGTCNDHLHTCPNDGNRWWQSNTHFHLWQQVTSQHEWQVLQKPPRSEEEAGGFGW